ncbi:DUF1016 N-terminal domain-containing protein [Sphingobacterium sp. JUb21]|uniref:DUF1016 N-terminal domain-containing protein n=1 Tax=Sphingobacterium sp. JUb21 TaxID=2940616 RepID=UPI0038F63423
MNFSSINGFSRRNLYAIRQRYLFYNQQYDFLPHPVAQIPWGHNRLIVTKIKNIEIAIFYCRAIVENGWTRDNLELAIKITTSKQKVNLLLSVKVHYHNINRG